MELRIDKSDWVRTRLGDVCTWYQRDIPNDAQEECGIEFYVTANHIDGGEVRFNRYDSLSDGQKGPTITKHFEEGDLLLSTRSVALRKAAIAPVSGVTGEKLLVLRTSIDSNMIPDLMPFVFQSDDFWNYAQNSASGSVNKFTSWTKIREYEFLLPPKDQQAEIAELLWAVDSSIEQMQSFLEEIKTSLKTIQNELFGCGRESVALGELCQSFSGFPFKSKKMTGHGEHKLLRGINIKEGCFEWNEEIDRFYPVEEEDGRKMTSIVMELGDVVVPMDGSKLGKNYAVVDDKAEGTFLVQRIACFKVSSVLESNLLEAFFGSVFFERMVQKHNTTSAIPHISLKQLRAIDIPVINASLESTLKHYKEMRGIQALSVARLDNSKSLLQAMIASFFETHV